MESCAWIIAVVIFLIGFSIFIWKTTRDKHYDPSLPHGMCEAKLGYGHGMLITCGRKTNHFSGQYWYCSDHPPKE